MQSGAHTKVAAIQLQGRVGDITGNLQLARDMADQAFANGARDRPPAFEPCRMWEFEHIRQPGEQKSLAVFCPVIDVA